MEEDILIQYYVVNVDLNMSPGKVASQTAHGALITYFHNMNNYLYLKWINNDMRKVILKGKQKDLEHLIKNGWHEVRDNGNTEVPPNSLTVVVSPVKYKNELYPLVKRLKLY